MTLATQFAGITFGKAIEDVTFGTSTTGKTIEITYVDTTVGLTKDQLRDHVMKILAAIDQRPTYVPA
jgi:hypothetical protein